MKTLIIAEAGVNHNGDFKLAKKMIKVAKKSGANYVKGVDIDKKRNLSNITKIISSNVDTSLKIINFVYKRIVIPSESD